MSSWAKLGTKCVCIDNSWSAEQCSAGRLPVRLPQLRETLTIDAIREFEGNLYLGFAEVPDTGSRGGWFFLAEYFRPLTPLELDQELFATWLNSISAATELEAV